MSLDPFRRLPNISEFPDRPGSRQSAKSRVKLGTSSSVKNLNGDRTTTPELHSVQVNKGPLLGTSGTFADYYIKSPGSSKPSANEHRKNRLSIFSPEKAKKDHSGSASHPSSPPKEREMDLSQYRSGKGFIKSPMYIGDVTLSRCLDTNEEGFISRGGISEDSRYHQTFGLLSNYRVPKLELEPSGFERANRSTENELKRYIMRTHAVNRSENRRILGSSVDYTKREYMKSGKEYAKTIEGLSVDEQDRLRKLDEDDESYYKQMESVFINGVKRIEKIEKQGKDLELCEGVWIDMEAETVQWQYCYIHVRGKPTPLTVSVKTKKESKFLRILVSRTLTRPNRGTPDFDFNDKKKFKLSGKSPGQEVFDQSYFYFAISAKDCGTVSMSASFGVPLAEKKPEKSRKSKLLTVKMTRAEEDTLDQDVAEIRQYFREKQLKLSKGVNLVEQNKSLEQFTPIRAAQQRELRKVKLHQLMESAILNKSHFQEQRKEKILTQQMLRETQKALKAAFIADNLQIAKRKARQAERQRPWIATLTLIKMLGGMFERFTELKKIKQEKLRKAVLAANFASKMRRDQEDKGDDTDHRAMLDIRMGLSLNALLLREKLRNSAEEMLKNMFLDLKTVKNIQNKCNVYIETIQRVQRAWRFHQRVKDGFKDLLIKLWNENFERVFLDVVQKGDGNQNMVKAINMKAFELQFKVFETASMAGSQKDAKDKFVQTYMKICSERYLKNYECYNAKVDRTEKKKMSLLETLKINLSTNIKEFERRKSHRSNSVNRSRMSIISEIEQNSSADNDSEPKSTVLTPSPPKFFLLPSSEELDELLDKIINGQILAAFRRASAKIS